MEAWLDLEWTSSDESIAQVWCNGGEAMLTQTLCIQPISSGTATITGRVYKETEEADGSSSRIEDTDLRITIRVTVSQ